MQIFNLVFVKSSDKLLNYLMFGQTFFEVKMEMLKMHGFHPWLNFATCYVIDKRMEVMPMIDIDPQSVYYYGNTLF